MDAGYRVSIRGSGSSLIELVIVLTITVLAGSGMYSFFITTSRTFQDEAAVARMLTTATNAMNRIVQDIRGTGTVSSAACAVVPLVSATNASPGSITVRTMLDDPAVRIELAPPPPAGQSQGATALWVVSTAGFQVGDAALITDGVQCSLFGVTQVTGGANPELHHNPTSDLNSPGGLGYVYPAATSTVYRVGVNRRISYTIDTSTPTRPWLTRDMGNGPIRLIPDVESLTFSYVMNDGSTVSDPATITTAAQTANIRIVSVRLTVRSDTRDLSVGGDGFQRQTLASSVKLRNLGS